METLHIEASEFTPEVYFGPEVDIFQIKGNSLPNNPLEFFEPIFNWLDSFLLSSALSSKINIDFKLNYFNTSSSKQIAKLFRVLESSNIKDNVTIKWFYDEDDFDMLEAGQRYDHFIKLRFDFMEN